MGTGPFEGVWTLLGIAHPKGTFWVGMDRLGCVGTLVGGCGPLWVDVDPFVGVWTLWGARGPFWVCVDPFGGAFGRMFSFSLFFK